MNTHPTLSLGPRTVIGPSHQTGFIRGTPVTANPLPSHTGGGLFCGTWCLPRRTKHLEETSKPSSSASPQTKDLYMCVCVLFIRPRCAVAICSCWRLNRTGFFFFFFCWQVIWKQRRTSKNIRHQWETVATWATMGATAMPQLAPTWAGPHHTNMNAHFSQTTWDTETTAVTSKDEINFSFEGFIFNVSCGNCPVAAYVNNYTQIN